MSRRRSLLTVFRQSREQPPLSDHEPSGEEQPEPGNAAAIQVLAHALIADLFGAGLRVQHLAAHAPEAMRPELEEVADQIDKVIQELRTFAFTHRA